MAPLAGAVRISVQQGYFVERIRVTEQDDTAKIGCGVWRHQGGLRGVIVLSVVSIQQRKLPQTDPAEVERLAGIV